MRCDQVQASLPAFLVGDLPSHKAAWMAQHLAGCQACQSELAAIRLQRKAAGLYLPIPARLRPTGKAQRVSRPTVNRRSGRLWLRGVFALVWLLLVAGGLFFFLRGIGAPVHRPEPSSPQGTVAPPPAEKVVRLGFEPAEQEREGVRLRVEGVAAREADLAVSVRFAGPELLLPADLNTWVQVFDSGWNPLSAVTERLSTDRNGLLAEVIFQRPQGQDRFFLQFRGVYQRQIERCQLSLPDPGDRFESPDLSLSGMPPGVTLAGYGPVRGLLHIELRAPERAGAPIPLLYLEDATGTQFAPAYQSRQHRERQPETILQYPIPKDLRLPVRLVRSEPTRKDLGNWVLALQLTNS